MATSSLLIHRGSHCAQWNTLRHVLVRQHVRFFSSSSKGVRSERAPLQPLPTVAVLYQAIDPPVINGALKAKKPGGKYQILA